MAITLELDEADLIKLGCALTDRADYHYDKGRKEMSEAYFELLERINAAHRACKGGDA